MMVLKIQQDGSMRKLIIIFVCLIILGCKVRHIVVYPDEVVHVHVVEDNGKISTFTIKGESNNGKLVIE